MSYANFKPTIWSKYIEKKLGKLTVFKPDCDFKHEGEAKRGAEVKILGIIPPTIKKYTPNKEIDAPENVQDASVYLKINQFDYFNIKMDNIDKAQSNGNLSNIADEATLEMAEAEDSFTARELAKGAGIFLPETKITTAAEMKDYIDEMFVKGWENSLSKRVVTLYLDPTSYNLFEKNLSEIKTDNTRQITTGTVGTYRNAHVKMTNNLYVKEGVRHIILKSTKAFAYANGIDELDAYKPEKGFGEAIKGLNTYGGKVVRPNEIICGKVSA